MTGAGGSTALERRPNRSKGDDWSLATQITIPAKIKLALNRFAPFKSAGTDGIFLALLQKGMEVFMPHLTKIYKASIA